MANYKIKLNSLNFTIDMSNVSSYFVDSAYNADLLAYDAYDFVDIYNMSLAGHQGTDASPYEYGDGLAFNDSSTSNAGFPALVNYRIMHSGAAYTLAVNAFDKINNLSSNIGYPVAAIGMYLTSDYKIGFSRYAISGKQTVAFDGADSMKIQVYRCDNPGAALNNRYWTGSGWSVNVSTFTSLLTNEHGGLTFTPFSIGTSPSYDDSYDIRCWTIINGITSFVASTRVKFKAVNDAMFAVVNDNYAAENASMGSNRSTMHKSMYDGKVFLLETQSPMTSDIYPVHLPLFGYAMI